MKILITGGAGFIGSALIRHLIDNTSHEVVNVDKLTYAGNLAALGTASSSDRYAFEQVDICDGAEIARVFRERQPDAVMHLAAESHVDRSIDAPADFIQTNVVGTYQLLEAALEHFRALPDNRAKAFRFLHISTDEVYGSLGSDGLFSETTAYAPNSPYSASKAGSDHLVRAWHHTFGLPTLITNCSNNYGPYQFPEKLIPLMILNALEGRELPVYGDGSNVRDWLYVEDHARALLCVLENAAPGAEYNIGGHNECRNIDVVTSICDLVDDIAGPLSSGSRRELIRFVADRPGHDQRYAIDASKIQNELGWSPEESFATGIRKTVEWFIDNPRWCGDSSDDGRQRRGLSGSNDLSGNN